MLVKIAFVVVGLYLLLIAFMALSQTRLLFPAHLAGAGQIQLPGAAQRLDFTAMDGVRLHGVHIPASRQATGNEALLLGFGGNAWNAETLATFLSELAPNRDVVVFHYRGYGPSEGATAARALMDDAIAAHDYVSRTIQYRHIIVVGLSIGSGPAMHLARHRKVAGAVLVTPFDSLKALAGDHYWWAPVGMLLRHQMEIAGLAAEMDAPVAIISAGQDSIVPPRRTDALRRSVRQLILDRTIAGAGHNDIYDHPEFASVFREALGRIEASASAVQVERYLQ
jgi:pimeloyl-ACP methyl ester carboxylesterase